MDPDVHSTSRLRRWLIPLVVVTVAAGIVIWNARIQQPVNDVISNRLGHICSDLHAGRDLSGQVNPEDLFTESATLAQIKRVITRATPAHPLQITPAVASNTGDAGIADSATHTVMVQIGGVDELGLRVKYDPDHPANIRVTGFWLPQPSPPG